MENSYDVLVLGGGIAGIAAALQAARLNKKVALIEKQCLLGGLATSGIVTIYLPICDGMGHQVSFGLAEELLLLSMKMGYQTRYPKPWLENGTLEEKKKTRYKVQYNPIYYAILLEQILKENNVDILYDCLLTNVYTKDRLIESVDIENVEGKVNIKAKSFIDCSGDARIAYLCKDDCTKYLEGNELASWDYLVSEGKAKLNMMDLIKQKVVDGKTYPATYKIEDRRYDGTKYEDVNAFIKDGHQNILNDLENKKAIDKDVEVVMMATMPQLRMIRCIDGKCQMVDENKARKQDSVGIVADWRRSDYVYEVPFGSLCSKNYDNVYFAGRCMSTDQAMWDVMRVIPCAAVTGQAAGVASCSYIDLKNDDIKNIQKVLVDNGVVLHIDDLNID